MYYVGLDLHKKYITGCVLDSQGAVVAEQRRLPPVLETLLGWLAPVGVPVSDLCSRGGRAWLATVALPPEVRQQVDRLVALVAHLDAQIAEQDRGVRELAQATPEAALLQTIPGIGPFGALLLLAEIGTIARFGSSHELAAYAGLVPSTRSSGGKTAHGSVGPAGSAWLKWLFVEAVQTLQRQPGTVRSQYERLLRAKGKPKATVAAARKLCCYVYWMMKERRSYDDWLRQRQQREVRPIQAVASVA